MSSSPGIRNSILIIDFGSQFTQLIARRIREAGAYSQIVPYHAFERSHLSSSVRGIILSGGPGSLSGLPTPVIDPTVFTCDVPILGICFGHQLLAQNSGAQVTRENSGSFGASELMIDASCDLFPESWKPGHRARVWMSFSDQIKTLPEGFIPVAHAPAAPFAAIADPARRRFGVQFHPEVVHTECGSELISNFVTRICALEPTWSVSSYQDQKVTELATQIASDHVLCALSGGVDSAVTAALLQRAIGDQLTCIFIDTGFMRSGEPDAVTAMVGKHFDCRFLHIDGSSEFLNAIQDIRDPEAKRKCIGKTFIELFEREANALGSEVGKFRYLAQGTLYSDVIESAGNSGTAHKIKSHHNVGGLPAHMNFSLIEPLRELFKDEVRELGSALGLPNAFLERQPFPGPGLAIRIIGNITRHRLDILRSADSIFTQEIQSMGLNTEIWQAFAVLLPVRSVGVMGDSRTYEQVCALRAVRSVDGMSADVFPFNFDDLERIAGRIVNEIRGINRVVYDITSKPPGTIEWE